MSIAPTDGPMSLGDIAHSVDRAQQQRAAANSHELTFDDLIDVINPLQHLPLISTAYRAITGDEISTHARAIGGGLYGGPVGALAAGASMAVEEAIGESPSEMLADAFGLQRKPDVLATATDQRPDAAANALATAPAATPPVAAQPQARPAEPLQTAAIPASPPAPPPPAPAATPTPAPAAETRTLPFTAKDQPRFFALPKAQPAAPAAQAAPTAPPAPKAAPAPQPTPQAPAHATLSAAQGDLLDRFISGGAREGTPAYPGGPATGASAEWLAMQMQANMQKYAESRASGGN